MNSEYIVQMKNITKRFPGVIANKNVSLNLKKGEVLALLGENGAGKSTLMNMLVGLYRPDEGEIYIKGKLANINSAKDSMALGVGMIHQEFMLVGNLTVAENIILGMKNEGVIPNIKKVSEKITSLSKKYGLQVYPNKIVNTLSVGEQQRVEILKLVYRGADILILDEPTAVLTPGESKDLNKILKIMLNEGKSAIFITHKMDEVIEFSHKVMVLRKGENVNTINTKDVTPKDLATMMVGRDILHSLTRKENSKTSVKLKLENVSIVKKNSNRPILDNINFSIYGGEILGIAGVAGNGQQVLTQAITGLTKITSGKIFINNKDMTNSTPIKIINSGVSHIPADRGKMGVVGDMSVGNNLAMKKYRTNELSTKDIIIQKSKLRRFAKKLINTFVIKTPSQDTQVKFLSGGNIQKTILAREIDNCKELLVAVYPSRGLDVGATESVRKNIVNQRDNGKAVLLVSEEIEELQMVCDRIAVMFEGKIMDILDVKDATTDKIGLLMSGCNGD